MYKRLFFALVALAVSFVAVPAQQVSQQKQILTIDQKVSYYARLAVLDERLFRALIWAESTGKMSAYSPKGAACLTQLMPGTARRYGLRVDSQVDDRRNVDKCLYAGSQYLAWLMQVFKGDLRLALAGYNAGEGAVMKFGWRVPPYRETVQYVEKILGVYTGQRGHGISAAYNQVTATAWVNEYYGARRLVSPSVSQRRALKPLVASQSPAEELPGSVVTEGAYSDSVGESGAQAGGKKGGARKVVRVFEKEQVTPKIRAESFYFYQSDPVKLDK